MSFANKLKFLFKDSVVYGITNALNKFSSIFLVPILTVVLSKNEFGQMDLLRPLVSIMASFLIFGLDSAIPRFIYDEVKNLKRSVLVASTGFWFQLFWTIGVLLVVYFNSDFFLNILDSGTDLKKEFEIIVPLVLFTVLISYSQNLTRWLLMRKEFLIISIGYIITNFSLILYLVRFEGLGVYGVFLGQLIATAAFSLIGLFLIRKQLSFQIDKQLLFAMLRFSIPLMFVAFLPALVPALDRMAINKYLGLEYVALYGIGARVMIIVLLPLQSINTAIGPFIYNHYNQPDASEVFNKILKVSVIGINCAIIGVLSISGFVNDFLADKTYIAGLVVIAPLMLARGVVFIAGILSMGIDLSKRTYLNIFVHIGGLITIGLALVILTPLLGLWGVAIAILLGNLIQLVLGSWLGEKSYPLSMARSKVFLQLALGAVFIVPHYFYFDKPSLQVLFYGLCTLLFYLLLISALNKKLFFSVIRKLLIKMNLVT